MINLLYSTVSYCIYFNNFLIISIEGHLWVNSSVTKRIHLLNWFWNPKKVVIFSSSPYRSVKFYFPLPWKPYKVIVSDYSYITCNGGNFLRITRVELRSIDRFNRLPTFRTWWSSSPGPRPVFLKVVPWRALKKCKGAVESSIIVIHLISVLNWSWIYQTLFCTIKIYLVINTSFNLINIVY